MTWLSVLAAICLLLAVGLAIVLILRTAHYRRTPPDKSPIAQAEQGLQGGSSTQARILQTVERSPNPIFSIDRQGLILTWNQACEITFAHSQEILGHSFQIILAPTQDINRINQMVRQVFEEKRVLSDIELSYRVKDGFSSHMVSRLYPLLDENGEVGACVFANTDITERKLREMALRQRLEELTVLHQAASACVEARDEDALIERITQIIGNFLVEKRGLGELQVNYGILLADENEQVLNFHASYQGLQEDFLEMQIAAGQGVTGQAVKTGAPQLVLDVRNAPEYEELDARTRSELSIPIRMGTARGNERIFGVINVEGAQTGAFSQADVEMLTILAEQLATAIERLRAQVAESRRVQELVAIAQVSGDLSNEFNLQAVLDSIARHAAEISNADASGLWMTRSETRFILTASFGVGDEFVRVAAGEGVAAEGTALGNAIRLRQPFQIPDIDLDPGYTGRRLAEMERIRSILALPLLRGESVLGGIVLWQRKPRRFTPEEETFLQALANQSVNALENARLLESEREQRRVAEVLRETGTALSATLDFDSVIDRLLDQAERLAPYDAANLMLVEDGHARVRRMRGYEAIHPALFDEVRNLDLNVLEASNLRTMIESGKPLIISDVRTFPGWKTKDRKFYLKSWAGAPILVQNKVAAFFSLEKLEAEYYLPEHAERLAVLASQAGLALQNALLFEETQRRLRETSLLSRVIAATATAKDLPGAATQVCIEVADFFQTRHALFFQFDADFAQGEVIAQYPLKGGASIVGIKVKLGNNALIRRVIEQRMPLAIENVQLEPLLAPVRGLLEQFSVVSALIIPVLLNDRVAGILGIGAPELRRYSQAELELTNDISSQLGQSLERLWLFTAVQEQAERMGRFARLGGELNRPLTVRQVIEGIGQGAMSLAQADRAAVYVRLAQQAATCAWWNGLSTNYVTQVIAQLPNVPGGQLLERTEPVLISDVLNLPETSPLLHLAVSEGFRSLGLWPLVYEGAVIAAVGIYYNQPYLWSDSQQELMRAFSPQAAVALQNAHLFEETNRRALQQTSLNEIISEAVAAPNLPDLLEIVLAKTLRALGLSQGSLTASGFRVSSGISEELEQHLQDALAEWLAQPEPVNSCLVIENREQMTENAPLADLKAQLPGLEVEALLLAPVISGAKAAGGLALVSPTPRKWLPEETALAEAVCKQVGSASERLDLLEATRQQALQVQRIMDTVPEGVLLLDEKLRIALTNPAAAQILPALLDEDHQPEQLARLGGRPIEDLLGAEPDKMWIELQSCQPPQRIFEAAARPVLKQLEQCGWVIVLREVTQEREQQKHAQMRERLATVGQLAAGIAHDFNNIMAAILIYADLLEMEPELSPTGRERLEIIQSQIQRATSLIRQILDFSRRAVMERVVLDLLPLIKELDKLLERVLPENIRLNLVYRPGSYMVKADPTHLQQAFMNLALNARDAMPDGGALQFTLERLVIGPEDYPELPDLLPGEWIRVAVRDTGSGIDPEALPHIFDPFYTTKPVGQGTGLGLAQVYGIIQSHGGIIDVHSQLVLGTTFHIYLPAYKIPPADLPNARLLEEDSRGQGETILVAEDDLLALEAIETLLKSQNYSVLSAQNGARALRLYEQALEGIHLVICDLVMPEMGGVQLYQVLSKKNPGIKFLFITGHPLDSQDQGLLEEGRVQWLQKPFSANELKHTLRRMLRK